MPVVRASKQNSKKLFSDDEEDEKLLPNQSSKNQDESDIDIDSDTSPPPPQIEQSTTEETEESEESSSSQVEVTKSFKPKSSPTIKDDIFYDTEDNDAEIDKVASDLVDKTLDEIINSPRAVRFESESSNMYRMIKQLEARIGLLESQMKTLQKKPKVLVKKKPTLKIPEFLESSSQKDSQEQQRESPLRSPSPTRKSRAKPDRVVKPHQMINPVTNRIINKPKCSPGWYDHEINGTFYNADDTFYNPTNSFVSKRPIKSCDPCKFRNQKGTESNPEARAQCKAVKCPNGTICSPGQRKCIPDGSAPAPAPAPECPPTRSASPQPSRDTTFDLSD